MDGFSSERRAPIAPISWLLATALAVLLAACSGQDVDAVVADGTAHAHAGRTAEALASFERALELDAEHPGALYNAGLAALILDEPQRAKGHLEALVASDPNDGRALHLLARARMILDDGEGALEALRRSVQAGFVDLEALNDDLFAPVRSDLRFVQLVSLAAQRSDQRAPIDDRGRMVLGGATVSRLQFPGEEPSSCAPAEEAHP